MNFIKRIVLVLVLLPVLFVAQDEFNTDNDRTPLKEKELDNIDVGPHNMQNRNVLHKIKNKVKTRGIKI